MAKKGHHKEKSHHTKLPPPPNPEHHHKEKSHHVEHHKHDVVRHQQHHKEHHQAPVTINMPAPSQETGSNKVLLENFVSLQRVMTNLAVKLDDLSSNISKLLELFEISAKALAEKEFDVEKDNKEILERLNGLVDQNKILARGMALMHERIPREQMPMQMPPQIPQMQQQMPQQMNQGMMSPQYLPSSSLIREVNSDQPQSQFQTSMDSDLEPPSPPSQSSPQRPPFESPI
jgi:hypothetical protein